MGGQTLWAADASQGNGLIALDFWKEQA